MEKEASSGSLTVEVSSIPTTLAGSFDQAAQIAEILILVGKKFKVKWQANTENEGGEVKDGSHQSEESD